MYSVGWKPLQRGDPHFDVFALRVVVLRLFDGVELAGSPWVVPDSSNWRVTNSGQGESTRTEGVNNIDGLSQTILPVAVV
jgi:hypothetical protein